jgi:hypothetical protein
MTSSSDENLLLRAFFLLGQTYGDLSVSGFTVWSEMNQNRTLYILQNM